MAALEDFFIGFLATWPWLTLFIQTSPKDFVGTLGNFRTLLDRSVWTLGPLNVSWYKTAPITAS